jgi:hypothetical protein
MRHWLSLVVLLSAVSLSAQEVPFSVSPASGPVGTEVTLKGNFGNWPYLMVFGSVYVPAERRDEHTLVALAPPHLPGTVPLNIFEYDFGIQTGLTYTFTGAAEDAFDRFLLPVFTEPIPGAFGSEFRTELTIHAKRGTVEVHGLRPDCIVLCVEPPDAPTILTPDYPDLPDNIAHSGRPGAFIYVPKGQSKDLSMYLRAFDVSRASDTFGTQIPIVPQSAFTRAYDDPIVIVGIPSDPKFRNRLRIYNASTIGLRASVHISSSYANFPIEEITIPGSTSPLDPGYVELGNFPTEPNNPLPLRVEIRLVTPPITPPPPPELWAFVSVTNNETQQITTITPR